MKTKVETPDAPKAPGLLSQAIVSNGFIFVAGQIHSTPDGKVLEGTIEEKTHQVIKNLQTILKAAGADLNDAVKVQVFVTDIADMPKLKRSIKHTFPSLFPPEKQFVLRRFLLEQQWK